MSVFNPELREDRESYFEKKHFSPDSEKRLLAALNRGKETFPDIILCPTKSCGCPIKIRFLEGGVLAQCPSCGWKQQITRDPSSTDETRQDDTDLKSL